LTNLLRDCRELLRIAESSVSPKSFNLQIGQSSISVPIALAVPAVIAGHAGLDDARVTLGRNHEQSVTRVLSDGGKGNSTGVGRQRSTGVLRDDAADQRPEFLIGHAVIP
jgi:hypothetical protein